MVTAGVPVLVDTDLGPQLHYVGTDDRGVELHVIAVPDDRRDGGLAVIHAMPTSYSRPWSKNPTAEPEGGAT